MKKFAYLGLVVVLLAFSVVPVLAAGPNGHGKGANPGQNSSSGDQKGPQNKGVGNGHGHSKGNISGEKGNQNPGMRMRTPFYLQGTVVSTDTTKIVKLTQGNELEGSEGSEGTESDTPTTSSTEDETPGNKVAITFNQLAAGDKVAIHGNVVGGVYEATFITVYVNGSQTGLDQTPPAGIVQILTSKLGFLHGHSFKVGRFTLQLP